MVDRTVSDAVSYASAGGQTDGPTSLMGQLRCLYEHHGRKKSYGYKKLFWVVNESKSCLEVYKNDQVYVPMDIIKAVELRNVSYAADKQNRFYVMILQLRRDYDVKFRLNSPEERDRWADAINRLIATYSTTNQRKTTLGQVIRHIAIASRQFGVQIAVDTGTILTEIPDDLLQYIVEAVDTALSTIAAITQSGERDVPRHYTLELRNIADLSEWDQRSTYDPTSRSVVLQVGLYRDVLSHVQFCCTEPDDVLLMMQSGVYRNPTIEGWLETDPGCVRGRRALAQYLNRDRPLPVSLQFAQNVRDSAKVEAYLRRFVSAEFFDFLISTLQSTVLEMLRCVERLRGQLPTTSNNMNNNSLAASPRGGAAAAGSQPLMPRSQSSASFFEAGSMEGASPTRAPSGGGGALNPNHLRRSFAGGGSGAVAAPAHSRSRSGGGGGAGLGATVSGLGGGGGAGHLHNRSTSTIGIFYRGTGAVGVGGGGTPRVNASFAGPSAGAEPVTPVNNATEPMALNLLLETVDGLSVLLEAFKVDACTEPPTVLLNYSPNYGKRYRSAMLLESKFFEAFPESSVVFINTRYSKLKEQLHQLSLRVLLAQLLQTLNSRLNAVCSRKSIRVVFQWGSLFSALRQVTTNYDMHDRAELLSIVAAVMNLYEMRLLQLVQQLNDVPFAPTELGNAAENMANFFSIFHSCVCCINVVFAPYSATQMMDLDAPDPPLPVVAGGIMTDTILVVPEELVTRVVGQLSSRGDAGLSATMRTAAPASANSSPLVPKVTLLPTVVKLGKWCVYHFSVRENIIPCDPIQVLKELNSDSDNDSDSDGTDGGVDLDIGDAVATERSAENTFLNTQRVVNAVYDQQGPSVDLKISVEDILQAARSLQKALDKKQRISQHDTEHIMNANLHKLRHMYATTLDEEVGTRFLTTEESETLLRSFCEYEENEASIPEKLRAAPVSERVQMVTNCDPEATSGSIGQYDFVAIARLALNELLPLEAVVSRKAWRNGFLFGLTNTGKSLITNCLRGMSRPTVATVGLARQVVSFQQWVLALHELGGRDSFRTNWEFYARRLPKVDFLIFVLDSMNQRAFHEAHQYLGEVAKEYPTKPLLIILNNYREHPIPMPLEQLLNGISLHKIRKENPDRKVIVCTTDLTIVHSVNRTVPAKLHKGMEQLCAVLLARSPADRIPSIPKPDPPPPEPEERARGSPGSVPSSQHRVTRSQNPISIMPTGRGGLAASGPSDALLGSLSQSPLTHDTTRAAFMASGERTGNASSGRLRRMPTSPDGSSASRTPGDWSASRGPGSALQGSDGSPVARAPQPIVTVPTSTHSRTMVSLTGTTPTPTDDMSSAAQSLRPQPRSLKLDAPSSTHQAPTFGPGGTLVPGRTLVPSGTVATDASHSLLRASSAEETLAWQTSAAFAHDTARANGEEDDEMDDDDEANPERLQRTRGQLSDTFLPTHADLNETAPLASAKGGTTRITPKSVPSVPLFGTTTTSSNSSSFISAGPLAGSRGLMTATAAPEVCSNASNRRGSASVTQAPEKFREVADQATAAAAAADVAQASATSVPRKTTTHVTDSRQSNRGGGDVGAQKTSVDRTETATGAAAADRIRRASTSGVLASSSSAPRSSGSRKEPSIRAPRLDGMDGEDSWDVLCSPAPILEDRQSVTRQRSRTAVPGASPSPLNHEYRPLHLSNDAHSPKWSSSHADE